MMCGAGDARAVSRHARPADLRSEGMESALDPVIRVSEQRPNQGDPHRTDRVADLEAAPFRDGAARCV